MLLFKKNYKNFLETLRLLSIPGFKKSLKKSTEQAKKGEVYSIEEIFEKKRTSKTHYRD